VTAVKKSKNIFLIVYESSLRTSHDNYSIPSANLNWNYAQKDMWTHIFICLLDPIKNLRKNDLTIYEHIVKIIIGCNNCVKMYNILLWNVCA